jgi:hypothetical protein
MKMNIRYSLAGGLMTAQALDCISTNLVLAYGGREENPVMAAAMAHLGGEWFFVKIAIAAVLHKPHIFGTLVLLPCKLAILAWVISTHGFAGAGGLIHRAAAEPVIMLSEPSPAFLFAGAILLTLTLRRIWQ